MKAIKQRITTGWTWVRILYLLMGSMILLQSIVIKQWMGVLFGVYFASMGLLGYGCAAGACYPDYNDHGSGLKNDPDISEINFEEMKEK